MSTDLPAPSTRAVFAENVRRARARLRITQVELATQSGLHRTFVSSVERAERNISVDNMQRLALALRTTVAALVTPCEVTENGVSS